LSETLQLDQVRIIQFDDAPRLLVEWSSRWDEFVTSIGPAFARSGPRLAGEAPHGIFPYRGLIASILLESFLLFVVAVLPRQLYRLRPYAAPRIRPDEVIYYSGDELPRTEDLGGAQSGKNARAGGEQAHHRTQTIRVARGSSLAQQVVDAPNLKLPSSTAAVANLLAFKSDPGPPPAEGLRSSLSPLTLPADVVAPAPTNVTREHSRAGIQLDSVVPPAPNVSADRSRSAPALNSAIVPPVPNVRSDHTLIAPTLTTSIIAPAPNVSREHALTAPALDAQIIAPASTRISRDLPRSAPALNGSVVPPAPTAAGREVAPSRVQMNATVVPPPVSAPAREATRTAKLNLPAPSVIAPPPSADSSRDLRRLESGSIGANNPAVVPPPPTQAGNTSFVSSVIGKLFGTQDIVPPPPSTTAAGNARNGGTTLAANIIPPPPAASAGSSASRRTSLGASIVPPPPSANVSEDGAVAGTPRRASLNSAVIPPPPAVGGTSSNGAVGTRTTGAASMVNGLAGNVVPPPPSIGSGAGLSGSSRTGSGLGGPGDAGSALAPPKSASGTPDNSGVVLSTQPGSSVAKPGSGGKGALAMSPAGGNKPGVGGFGGGTGIGQGTGPGSGLAAETSPESATEKIAENSGAGKTGSGRGSDVNARGGISPTPGPGGAGSVPTGSPAVPGVAVRGGSTTTVITLPSFADTGSAPSVPGRSSIRQQQGPAITIVATSRSGGAFDFYGKLPGDNYTVYVDTPIGTAVMQFAEVNPAAHTQAGALTGPQGIRTTLPADLPHARVVVKCTLDASGNLRNLQVLEPGPAAMTAKIVAALPSWKFRPAMRGVQPVEVNAILGFNIDTNDRN
jgi:hypothetical protein